MKRYRISMIAAGLLGWAVTGCDYYAKKSELAELRARYEATHDTLAALWNLTNAALVGLARMDSVPKPPKCPPYCRIVRIARDTVPPPPKCPPFCEQVITLLPPPERSGAAGARPER